MPRIVNLFVEQVTLTVRTSPPPIVPEASAIVQVCEGRVGGVATVTSNVLPLASSVANVKLPFDAIGRSSPPLLRNTRPLPARPATVPPTLNEPVLHVTRHARDVAGCGAGGVRDRAELRRVGRLREHRDVVRRARVDRSLEAESAVGGDGEIVGTVVLQDQAGTGQPRNRAADRDLRRSLLLPAAATVIVVEAAAAVGTRGEPQHEYRNAPRTQAAQHPRHRFSSCRSGFSPT